MTLSQLNRIASTQKTEPDLPGVHSSGMVASMPSDMKSKLFQEMREAIGLTDDDPTQFQAQLKAAQRRVEECETALAEARLRLDELTKTNPRAER